MKFNKFLTLTTIKNISKNILQKNIIKYNNNKFKKFENNKTIDARSWADIEISNRNFNISILNQRILETTEKPEASNTNE